jgi:chaperonin GroEL (HSP60 family)
LQIIPLTLAQNADFDSPELLGKLKTAHQEGQTWQGLDLERGETIETLDKVIEPVDVMLAILQSATEATEMILRVDQNIFHQPRKPFLS